MIFFVERRYHSSKRIDMIIETKGRGEKDDRNTTSDGNRTAGDPTLHPMGLRELAAVTSGPSAISA
ncbi:hypothetical protein BACI349Y_750061 [Bacillus sp. 349Y]|nr:hypothetical protein BACI349Y_750061 [Bacillus sp. 349Y]